MALLVSIGVVYCLVANSEYEDSKELDTLEIKGESAEKHFESAFFLSTALVNFILAGIIVKSSRNLVPYFVTAGISVALILIYIASRTIGVPVVGVEFYVGRLDIISKVLQVVVIVLCGFAIYHIRKIMTLKEVA